MTIPSLITEGSGAKEVSSWWTFTGILNLFCDFVDHDHNRAIQFFFTLWWCAIKPSFVAKGSAVQIIYEKVIFWLKLSLTMTLTLKTANQSFWKTIWLIMIHNLTKFCSKSSAFQKMSSGYTVNGILKFCCDLDLDHNKWTIQFLN